MGLESATYIGDLDATYPEPTDLRRQGDDHLRLIKLVLQTTFPRATTPFRFPQVLAKTSNYTIVVADLNSLVECDATAGGFTITLPVGLATIHAGHRVSFIKTNSSGNVVTIAPASGTIQGESSFKLLRQYESIIFEWSGDEWFVIRSLTATQTFKSVTASATLTVDDIEKTIICSPAAANMTLVLPAVANCLGRMMRFKRISSLYKTTIDANGSETIDGATTVVLESDYDELTIVGHTSGWLIFDSRLAASENEVALGASNTKMLTPLNIFGGLIGAGDNVASANSIAIGTGGYIAITGTTSITTAITFTENMVGRRALLKFTGASCRISHNAAILLPGAATLTMRTDDILEVLCEAGSVARVLGIYRANHDPRIPDAIFEHQETSGTGAGDFTSGDWRRRPLNTTVRNVNSLIVLAANKFTLPVGRWMVEWESPAYLVDSHQTCLYNETGSSVEAYGSTASTPSGAGVVTVSSGIATINLTSDTEYSIRHQCQTSRVSAADDGMGKAAGFGTEVYTRVKIYRAL